MNTSKSPLVFALLGSPLCRQRNVSLSSLVFETVSLGVQSGLQLAVRPLDLPVFLCLPVLGLKVRVHSALWKVLESSFRLPSLCDPLNILCVFETCAYGMIFCYSCP